MSTASRHLSFLIFPVLLVGCATTPVKQVMVNAPLSVSADSETKPVMLSKIVVKLARGQVYGKTHIGVFCLPHGNLTWRGGRVEFSDDDLSDAFREEFEKAGYTVVGNTDSLFPDPSEAKAQYLVGGLVTKLQANVCYPYAGFDDFGNSSGGVFMKVDWQVYSTLDRRIVFQTVSEGSFETEEVTPAGFENAVINAFGFATQNLLADTGFHKLITTKVDSEAENVLRNEPLSISSPSLFDQPLNEHIDDVRMAVVTIFADKGHGSGVFVSNEGYVLTNEHVVGEAELVKVKLATGREGLGEVVRRDTRRDVALIKLEKWRIPPIPLNVIDLTVGDDVFAVGSPLDDELSTTFSKGIVSGYRTFDGYEFIQSDVNVLPGSSGGPLVDQYGNVVGLTVKGILVQGGVSSGMNFFAPIRDVLDRLGLKLNQPSGRK